MPVDKIIVLVTGANTGLGYETIKALCASDKPYKLFLGGRSLEKANEAAKTIYAQFNKTVTEVEAIQVDLEDDATIERAFKIIKNRHGRLDVLINNAGAQFDSHMTRGKLTMRQAWNKSWEINTTGTQIITHTFAPLLLASSNPRVLFITTSTSTLTEQEQCLSKMLDQSPAAGWPKTSTGGMSMPAYRAAKAGMNMMMREWVRILKEDGVKVWAVSPGFMATALGGDAEKAKAAGGLDPAIGALFVKDVVEGQRDEHAGKVIRRNNMVQPW